MRERSWAACVWRSFFGALGIGLAAGVATGVISTAVSSGGCLPEEECLAAVYGFGLGIAAGAVAFSVAVLVLALRLRVGAIFGVGAGLAPLVLIGGWYAGGPALIAPFGLLATMVFAGAVVVSNAYRPASPGSARVGRRPTRLVILAASGAVALAGLPLVTKLIDVSSEQRRIEAVVERPLQPRLDKVSSSGIQHSDAGIDYVVTLQAPGGTRTADVSVTTRLLAVDQAPCTGFADRTEGAVTECTLLAPNVWRARGAHGEVHYFVRAEDRQWGYVRSERYDYLQRWHDAQAAQVARSLEPRSAWHLAVESADCEFCQWFTGQR